MDAKPEIRAAATKLLAQVSDKDDFDKILITIIAESSSMKAVNQGIDAALDALEEITKIWSTEKMPILINLLDKEKRFKVKEKIGQTLNEITGEKFGCDKEKWGNWWEEMRKQRRVTKQEIDKAIEKGKDYLLQELENHRKTMLSNNQTITSTYKSYHGELVFYALIHAGVSIGNPNMKSMLDYFLAKKPENTYKTALLAMALCDLDKIEYLPYLIEYAQFLIGNESEEGNWTYGFPIIDSNLTPIPDKTIKIPKQAIVTNPQNPISNTESTKSPQKLKIKIPTRYKQKNIWDNSNTQYALLGLRACAEAGIEIPREAWEDAEKHLLKTQMPDGGWSYQTTGKSYGSMTAGGLAGLIICKYYQGKDIADNKQVKAGIDWLAKNFSVTENPCAGLGWHYYYLYAIERAGVIANTELFGKNEWYQLGARYLIDAQNQNGSWSVNGNDPILNTCFAILFLKRATKSLKAIETVK
jgi:hypothetical protein